MSEAQNYDELIDKYIQGTLSPAEKHVFFQLFDKDRIDPRLEEFLLESYEQGSKANIWPENFRNMLAGQLAQKIVTYREPATGSFQFDAAVPESKPNKNISKPASRIHFLRTSWFRYAAAVMLLFCSAAYFWNSNKVAEKMIANDYKRSKMDIPPGGEKAVLTLADGTKIPLDKAANGNLAKQGNTQVVKLTNGQIVYNVRGLSEKEVMWNTMSTPAGGQYQVTLPDGTKVWLNAASSINYPAAFVGKKRIVKISGEVYFEVAKDKLKPFIVDINEKSTVQVLGTTFNINSYLNEGSIKTTLIEGSVQLSNHPLSESKAVDRSLSRFPADKINSQPGSVILKPGQQAQILTSTDQQLSSKSQALNNINVVNNSNLAQALAWKNGLFDFNGSDLHAVMRQLERWYDIKVQYEGAASNIIFRGKMYRNTSLSDVLEMFQKMGVKFRMEGKKLIVF